MQELACPRMKSLLILLSVAFATLTQAATLKLTGNVGYKVGAGNHTVTINVDGITNQTSGGTSGTVLVQLWGFSTKYAPGAGAKGIMIGEFKLNGLDGGTSYKPLTKTVTAKMPGSRTSYFMTIILSEYGTNGYVMKDYRNFTNQATLSPAKLFEMQGPWSWKTNYAEGMVNMKVAKVKHYRSTATGSLKLELWACSRPYTSGTISGTRVGSASLKPLEKGYEYTNLDKTAPISHPQPGNYYMVLLLLEYSNGKYTIATHLNSSQSSVFK